MKSYILALALSFIGTLALGQVKVKPQTPFVHEKDSRMPILKLDSADGKYNMPVKKFKRMDSLAPMPGTEKMSQGGGKKENPQFRRLEDSLKVKDFKLKIDSLYPKQKK